MKRIITFSVLSLLALSLFTGCNAHNRHLVTELEHDMHREHAHHHDARRLEGQTHNRHTAETRHHYRSDGQITDTDGIIGNGIDADRPSPMTDDTLPTRTAQRNAAELGANYGAHGAKRAANPDPLWVDANH